MWLLGLLMPGVAKRAGVVLTTSDDLRNCQTFLRRIANGYMLKSVQLSLAPAEKAGALDCLL